MLQYTISKARLKIQLYRISYGITSFSSFLSMGCHKISMEMVSLRYKIKRFLPPGTTHNINDLYYQNLRCRCAIAALCGFPVTIGTVNMYHDNTQDSSNYICFLSFFVRLRELEIALFFFHSMTQLTQTQQSLLFYDLRAL